jgi:hypothetical protein
MWSVRRTTLYLLAAGGVLLPDLVAATISFCEGVRSSLCSPWFLYLVKRLVAVFCLFSKDVSSSGTCTENQLHLTFPNCGSCLDHSLHLLRSKSRTNDKECLKTDAPKPWNTYERLITPKLVPQNLETGVASGWSSTNSPYLGVGLS